MKTEKKKKSSKKIVLIVLAVVLSITIGVSAFLFFNDKNKVMAECYGVKIRENTYRMYVYQAMQEFMTTFQVNVYTEDFWNVEIEGKLPEEHIKENALNRLKLYAYYKSGCEKEGISLSEEAHQQFISYYDAYHQDYDATTFGVEKQFFLDHLYETYLFDMYFTLEAGKLEITEEELKEAFDENREDSARVTVKTVFLQVENENWEELKAQAYAIKEEVLKGTSIDTFIAQDSDYKGNNGGQFVVVSTSSYSSTFGKEYTSSVLNGNEGDVLVLKTSTGYCVNEFLKVEMKESAKEDLIIMIQAKKYEAKVDKLLQNSDEFTVKITNQRIYDSVSLPGFDVEEPEESEGSSR